MSLRKNIIALSLFNAATLLKEQAEAAQQPDPAAIPPAPQPEAAPAAPGEGESPLDEQGNPITLDKMIDRINVIRSGLSFEEPEVYGKLTTLFKKMPSEDKVKFNKQLTEIGAIVQNIPAEKQTSEAAPPAPEAPMPAPGTPAPPPAV
jgi:hypothetical protein